MSKKYTLEELYAKGQISYKPIVYRDIKIRVKGLVASGLANGQAVNKVASEMGMTRQAIYRAIKLAL